MTPDQIIQALRNAGVSVRADGKRLQLDPRAKVPDELVEHVRKQREAILAELENWPGKVAPARSWRAEPPRHDELARRTVQPQVVTGRRRWRR